MYIPEDKSELHTRRHENLKFHWKLFNKSLQIKPLNTEHHINME
jgi:hypothetical protein